MSVLPRPHPSPRRARSRASPPAPRSCAPVPCTSCPRRAPCPAVVGAGLRVPTLHGEAAYANLDHAASTPGARDGQGGGRPRARDLLLGAPRRRLRLPPDERVVRAGPRRGRRTSSARARTTRSIFTRTTTDSWALLEQGAAEPHDGLRLRHRAPLDPAAVGPLPHRAPARPADASRTRTPCSRRRSPTTRRGTASSSSPPPPTSPVRCGPSSASPRSPTSTAPGSPSTPPSCRRTAPSTSPPGTPTTSRSRATRRTPPSARACSPGAPTGSTPATPTCSAAARPASVTEDGTTWATGPARHEGGSPNVIGAIALAAACATITRHREAIEEHESRLLDRLRAGLDEVPGVEVLSIFGDDSDRVGVVAFTVDGWDSSLVSQVLSVEHGIGVRDGKFCAHLLVDELLEDPWGERSATAVRASIGLGSTARGRRAPRRRRRAARRARHRRGVDPHGDRLGARGRRPARRRGRATLVTAASPASAATRSASRAGSARVSAPAGA